MKNVWFVSQLFLFFLNTDVQIWHDFSRRLSLFHYIDFAPWSKTGPLLLASLCSSTARFIPLAIPHFDHCSFLSSRSQIGPIIQGFFLRSLWHSLVWVFCLSITSLESLVNIHEIVSWDSDWYCTEPMDQTGKN